MPDGFVSTSGVGQGDPPSVAFPVVSIFSSVHGMLIKGQL